MVASLTNYSWLTVAEDWQDIDISITPVIKQAATMMYMYQSMDDSILGQTKKAATATATEFRFALKAAEI